MKQKHALRLMVLASVVSLAACQAPGENLKANVYQANQVNQAQNATVINILAVLPAKIEADNTQRKQVAQVAGGVLGAVAGGVIGSSVAGRHDQFGATVVGGAAGGVAGVAAGSLVPNTVLVDGVSLTYEVNGRTLNSAQVGQLCEYTPGKAVMVSTSPTETRIQPNATCPVANKS